MTGPVHFVRNRPFANIQPMSGPTADPRDQDMVDAYNRELDGVQSAHLHLIDPKGVPGDNSRSANAPVVRVDGQGRKHVLMATNNGRVEWTLSRNGNLKKEVITGSGNDAVRTADEWTRTSSFKWTHQQARDGSKSSHHVSLSLENGRWTNTERTQYSPGPVTVRGTEYQQTARREYNDWLSRITSAQLGEDRNGPVRRSCFLGSPGKVLEVRIDDANHPFVDQYYLGTDGSVDRTSTQVVSGSSLTWPFQAEARGQIVVIGYLRNGDDLDRYATVLEGPRDREHVVSETHEQV